MVSTRVALAAYSSSTLAAYSSCAGHWYRLPSWYLYWGLELMYYSQVSSKFHVHWQWISSSILIIRSSGIWNLMLAVCIQGSVHLCVCCLSEAHVNLVSLLKCRFNFVGVWIFHGNLAEKWVKGHVFLKKMCMFKMGGTVLRDVVHHHWLIKSHAHTHTNIIDRAFF